MYNPIRQKSILPRKPDPFIGTKIFVFACRRRMKMKLVSDKGFLVNTLSESEGRSDNNLLVAERRPIGCEAFIFVNNLFATLRSIGK